MTNVYFSAVISGLLPAGIAALMALGSALLSIGPAEALAQRPSTDRHVRELARYLDGVKIAEPVTSGHLAAYPVLVEGVPQPAGRWLSMDAAIARGTLVVSEKGTGSVPIVLVENRSRDEHVFIMTGEVIAGGMQTRTVRHDVAVAPGQRIELDVLCVEAHRWRGDKGFSGGKAMLPQSIQGELRKGADQQKVWDEVARNNAELKAENSTGSLKEALDSTAVRSQLDEVRRRIVPEMPQGTVGFIFVSRGRALGVELFGREDLARDLLPKLLDSYAVDYVILKHPHHDGGSRSDRAAIDLFERVCSVGSDRTTTPGAGSGIRTREGDLLGDGVSLDGAVVHYGAQVAVRPVPVPRPRPRPPIIYPRIETR